MTDAAVSIQPTDIHYDYLYDVSDEPYRPCSDALCVQKTLTAVIFTGKPELIRTNVSETIFERTIEREWTTTTEFHSARVTDFLCVAVTDTLCCRVTETIVTGIDRFDGSSKVVYFLTEEVVGTQRIVHVFERDTEYFFHRAVEP